MLALILLRFNTDLYTATLNMAAEGINAAIAAVTPPAAGHAPLILLFTLLVWLAIILPGLLLVLLQQYVKQGRIKNKEKLLVIFFGPLGE